MNRRDFFRGLGAGIVAAPAIVYTATTTEPVATLEGVRYAEPSPALNYNITVNYNGPQDAKSIIQLMRSLQESV